MCSTIVAREMGMMVMAAVASMAVSTFPLPKRPKTVSLQVTGRPIQAASRTAVKSTCPAMAPTT